MDKRDDGGPAFPGEQGQTPDGIWNQTFNPGMSLRDWFAGQALAPVLDSITDEVPANATPAVVTGAVAEMAYAIADAMLAERAKGEGQ